MVSTLDVTKLERGNKSGGWPGSTGGLDVRFRAAVDTGREHGEETHELFR